MLDLHAHFLPGVDDGPLLMADTLALLRNAAAHGFQVMVATPHNKDVWLKSSLPALRTLFEEVREAARQGNIPLELHLGMENHLEPDLPQRVDEGLALTLAATRYILVELPFNQYPLYGDDTLFALQVRGLTPVIAHPERQVDIQRRPQLLRALVERGMLAQVTGESITGEFGPEAQASVRTLLKQGLVHLMASDTHAPEGRRSPQLEKAVAAAAQLVGEQRARALVEANPRAMLNGQEVSFPLPER